MSSDVVHVASVLAVCICVFVMEHQALREQALPSGQTLQLQCGGGQKTLRI